MRLRAAIEQLLPWLWHRSEVRRIRALIATREKKDEMGSPLDPKWEHYLALEKADLQDALKVELARREYVHRRAQTFLSSIAVMSAFTIGAAGVLRTNEHAIPAWIIAPAIVIAFSYLALAGWYALATVRPGKLYDLFLQNRMEGSLPMTDDNLKRMLVSLIQWNQAYNLIFAALAERTYRSTRNGVIALVVVLSMVVADAATLHRPSTGTNIGKATSHGK